MGNDFSSHSSSGGIYSFDYRYQDIAMGDRVVLKGVIIIDDAFHISRPLLTLDMEVFRKTKREAAAMGTFSTWWQLYLTFISLQEK